MKFLNFASNIFLLFLIGIIGYNYHLRLLELNRNINDVSLCFVVFYIVLGLKVIIPIAKEIDIWLTDNLGV